MNFKLGYLLLLIFMGSLMGCRQDSAHGSEKEMAIQNEYLRVKSKRFGAELTSILLKEDRTEYLWQGDSTSWADQAIIQFPIVGNVRNNAYRLDGKTYQIMSHGFARVSDFTIIDKSDDHIAYQLKSNENSRKIYPYDFVFTVAYQLVGKTIQIHFKVENKTKGDMYFSLGYHPGFNCPMLPGQSFNDYFLEFENKETLERSFLENNLVIAHKELLLDTSKIVPISRDLFKDDALILENFVSKQISLKSNVSNKSVTVAFDDAEYLGIWSPNKSGNFVCIEPWYGLPDFVEDSVDFDQKKGMQLLAQNQVFKTTFEIQIK